MRLALDHHYSTQIAIQLRERGHDVVAVVERNWETEGDETLLELCHEEARALLTNNVGDFAVIARRWSAQGDHHSGLVFSSDTTMPRGRNTIGRYVSALDELMSANPADTAFVDRIHWLSDASPSRRTETRRKRR